jgi:hypothetical protein
MNADRKYIPIKEDRGWYFVEYHPPVSDFKFASLHLIIAIENPQETDIVNAMENELKDWLGRYQVPLFVSSFDNKGDLYHLSKKKGCDHLTGFFDQDKKICLYWRLLKDEEIPDIALNREYLDDLYSNFTFKTYTELDAERQKRRRQIGFGWLTFFTWLVMIPLFVSILEYFSDWLSLVVLIYSFYKALQKGIELIGEVEMSKKKKEQEIEMGLKDHYYYHCQMNPKGFERLRLENFEKLSKDEIRKEAEALKNNRTSNVGQSKSKRDKP